MKELTWDCLVITSRQRANQDIKGQEHHTMAREQCGFNFFLESPNHTHRYF